MEVKRLKKEGDSILFLHEQGYSYFNMNRLTYPELNTLVTAHNRRVEEQMKNNKK